MCVHKSLKCTICWTIWPIKSFALNTLHLLNFQRGINRRRQRERHRDWQKERERGCKGVGLIDMRNRRIKNFRHMKRLRLLLLWRLKSFVESNQTQAHSKRERSRSRENVMGERKYFTLLLIEIYWDLCIIWRTKQKHKKCENKTKFTSCQSQLVSLQLSLHLGLSFSSSCQTFCAVRWTNKNNTHKTFDEILGWRVAWLAAVGICPGNKRQLCHQQRQMSSGCCCCCYSAQQEASWMAS